jgi:hypothetical protein
VTFLFVNKKLIYRFLDEEEHQNLIKMAARPVLDKLADRICRIYKSSFSFSF